jgi:hypothetical protein
MSNRNSRKNNKNEYTSKQFENDLNKLENLILSEKSFKGGFGEEREEEEVEDEDEGYQSTDAAESTVSYDYNNEEYNEQYGGKKNDSKTRQFKLVEVDGKPFKSDSRASIREEDQTPVLAARRLFRSLANSKKLSNNAKSKFKAVFYIEDITRGTSKKGKAYGPYHGSYHKYTDAEIAKAKHVKEDKETGESRSIIPKFKISCKLHKDQKKSMMKGGYMM